MYILEWLLERTTIYTLFVKEAVKVCMVLYSDSMCVPSAIRQTSIAAYLSPHLFKHFLLNNQPDALIIQIYSVIKLYIFRASSLPIIRSFLMYNRHW